MSDIKIADALGISNNSIEYSNTALATLEHEETGNDQTDDYNLSRDTIRTTIQTGADALNELLKVASASQKARDYEVAAKLMQAIGDLTKNLKDVHNVKTDTEKRISNLENENQSNITVEKAVFVGTTAHLLKEIKKARVIENDAS